MRFTCVLVSRALVATTPIVGVLAGPRRLQRRSGPQQRRARPQSCRPAFRDARDDAPGVGIDDVADRIDRDDGADDEAVGKGDRGAADAGLHRSTAPPNLADRRARARADAAFGDGRSRSRPGGAIAAVGRRPDRGLSADAEIEQDRGRDDRHAGRTGRPADVVLLEPADGRRSRRRGRTRCRPTGRSR